jgi:peroxin-3
MFTVLALYPSMAQQILEELRVEPILLDLQQKRVAITVGTSSVRAVSTSDEGDTAARASMITTHTSAGEAIPAAERTVLVSQKKTKIELWNDLKILSIPPPCPRGQPLTRTIPLSRFELTSSCVYLGLTRTLTLIYSLSALVLLSRIQFSLLGRQAYVTSILALAPESTAAGEPAVQQIRLQEENEIGDLELQRTFLSFTWWLVHRGWRTIMSRVHDAMEDVFLAYLSPTLQPRSRAAANKSVSPKEVIGPDGMRTLLAQVRQQVDFVPGILNPRPFTFLSAMLPPTSADEILVLAQDSQVPDTVSLDLRHLLDETSDIVESPAAMAVFHILLDRLVEEFVGVLEAETKASRDGVVRLANYLPVATKEAAKIADGVPNRYFQVCTKPHIFICAFGGICVNNACRLWRRWRS